MLIVSFFVSGSTRTSRTARPPRPSTMMASNRLPPISSLGGPGSGGGDGRRSSRYDAPSAKERSVVDWNDSMAVLKRLARPDNDDEEYEEHERRFRLVC